MKVLGYFDRCYVVNLPTRADRRRQMSRMLDRAGLAIRPGSCEFFPATRPEDPGEFPSIGARGCFLSHLGVLRRARDEGLSNVLIMEDDLEIAPGFANDPGPVIDALRREDWGIAYLGHALGEEPDSGGLGPIRRFAGHVEMTHFYAVNGAVLPRLVDFLEAVLGRPGGHPDGGPMHVDGAYNIFRQRNADVATWIAWPSQGHQRSSRSDITAGWLDRIPIVSNLVEVARSVRRR